MEKHAKIINKNYTKQTTIIKEENLFKKIKIKIKEKHIMDEIPNQKELPEVTIEGKNTFHNSCNTSASIFPGTLVAKILAISRRVTAISGVA